MNSSQTSCEHEQVKFLSDRCDSNTRITKIVARYPMGTCGSTTSSGNREGPFDWKSAIESTDWRELLEECSRCAPRNGDSVGTWGIPVRRGAWRTIPLNLSLSAGDLRHLSSEYRDFRPHEFWLYRLKVTWPFLYMVHDYDGRFQWIVRFIEKEADIHAAEFLETVEPGVAPDPSESTVWVAQILGDLIPKSWFSFVDEDRPDLGWRWQAPGK
ncbi:MAG: hypothetical protein AABM33_07630 [Pseudomonadota bacterium]